MNDQALDKLRDWALTVEERLGQEEDSSAQTLRRIKKERDSKIKRKVLYDKHLIDKEWKQTDVSCECGRSHTMIEVDGDLICPVKYYLTLGRLALWNQTDTPGRYLYTKLMMHTRKGNTMMQFKQATKEQAKLRLALFGAAGTGKSYSALRIATGMADKIAAIDTERGSLSKYADRFKFDVLELTDRSIAKYVQAINAAQKAGYEVLIIDSLSHAWQELLDEVDRLARSKFSGNRWAAWSEGTPKQRALVDAILTFNGHVIGTMRVKTEWDITRNNGKTDYARVGLSPEQGKGIEYEFDMLMRLSDDHEALVIKDRTGKFQDQLFKPTEDFGAKLAAWLSEGVEAPEDDDQEEEEPSGDKWNMDQVTLAREEMKKKFTATYEALAEVNKAQTHAFLYYLRDLTEEALGLGENEDFSNLVNELFDVNKITDAVTGQWLILEDYLNFVKNAGDKEAAIENGKKIVAKAVEEQISFEEATAQIEW